LKRAKAPEAWQPVEPFNEHSARTRSEAGSHDKPSAPFKAPAGPEAWHSFEVAPWLRHGVFATRFQRQLIDQDYEFPN
jgi:hypothetical protein